MTPNHTDKSLFELRQYAVSKDAEIAKLRKCLEKIADQPQSMGLEADRAPKPLKNCWKWANEALARISSASESKSQGEG